MRDYWSAYLLSLYVPWVGTFYGKTAYKPLLMSRLHQSYREKAL